MNRRGFFRGLAAVPVAAVVAPLAIANGDGVALTSMAHPLALEPMPYEAHELNHLYLETRQVEFPEHAWEPYRCVCLNCGATHIEVENGDRDRWCYLNALPLSESFFK